MGKTLDEMAGKFYMGKSIITPSNPLEDQFRKVREDREEKQLAEKLAEIDKIKQDEIESKLEKIETLPMGARVILLPYLKNPYRRIRNESGIILDTGGMFLNPDSGEWDKEKELVGCAKIIEVGPETKWLNEGDDVFYDTRTVYPFPLYGLGYVCTSEHQIIGVLNEGLKERFNKIKNKDLTM